MSLLILLTGSGAAPPVTAKPALYYAQQRLQAAR